MEPSFVPFDLHRIFIGDGPLLFLLEIVFRTTIMYGYSIFLLRLLGKRGMGQLSTLELAIIICFGSAVGDPMIGAQMPISYGVIAITTVALLQVGMEKIINRHDKLEKLVEGKPNCIVDQGLIVLDVLKKENLSHADLFRSLRSKEVEHLGEVHKAFFETSGEITVIFNSPRKIKKGLSIMPEEVLPPDSVQSSPFEVTQDGVYCCVNCGHCSQYKSGGTIGNCEKCSGTKWQALTN